MHNGRLLNIVPPSYWYLVLKSVTCILKKKNSIHKWSIASFINNVDDSIYGIGDIITAISVGGNGLYGYHKLQYVQVKSQ